MQSTCTWLQNSLKQQTTGKRQCRNCTLCIDKCASDAGLTRWGSQFQDISFVWHNDYCSSAREPLRSSLRSFFSGPGRAFQEDANELHTNKIDYNRHNLSAAFPSRCITWSNCKLLTQPRSVLAHLQTLQQLHIRHVATTHIVSEPAPELAHPVHYLLRFRISPIHETTHPPTISHPLHPSQRNARQRTRWYMAEIRRNVLHL